MSAQLDLINTTNMSFFDRTQQTSILTLKATIQVRLGLYDEADKVCIFECLSSDVLIL